ncbi:MAG: acyltransferase [Bacteroidales bacterium]|nr:acyltransferase [Bacteroidales bacterium]
MKETIKKWLKKITPGWIRFRLYPFIVSYNRALWFYLFNHFVAGIPSFTLRTLYLRKIIGYTIGKGTALHMNIFITGKSFSIAENSVINRRCYLDCRGGIEIGKNVSISPEVYIISSTHLPDDPEYRFVGKKVVIDDYVWIGAKAIILPGVHLGKGCIVGAGSVVTRDVEPFQIVAGNPARFIRMRNENLTYTINFFSFFDTDIPQKSLFKKP